MVTTIKGTIQCIFIHKKIHFLIIILLIIGIFFRFINIDRKIYEGDEIYTSLRISGYTMVEMEQQIRNDSVVSIKDLQKYQFPNSEKNVFDTIKGLALEESQLTPLYFILARFWVQLFGNSVVVIRSFSAYISFLAFPGIYWLCQELFESPLIGWIAMALIAISPVHVIYAQVARSYSLWIVIILLSSAALLRAIRVKTNLSWVIYSVTVILGLYTHLFFSLVAIGQGIYVAVIERSRLSKTSISYMMTFLIGLIAFSPWLFILITSPNPETLSWTQTKEARLAIAIKWVCIVSRAFFDMGANPTSAFKFKLALVPCIIIVLILIVYSIYFLCRSTPKRIWFLVLTLIGSVGLPLILADFIFQHHYGTTRYALSSTLGIQIALAYLMATKIQYLASPLWQQKLWSILASMIIFMGVISCSISAQAEVWWNSYAWSRQYILPISDRVNQSDQPLVISDYHELQHIQAIGYQLEPKVQFLLVEPKNIPEIPNGFSDVFLFRPSESLRTGLERKYHTQIQRIYLPLWKLENHTHY